MRSTDRTKLLNFGWLMAEQVVRVAISFLVMTLVARHLGPERFGAYVYLFGLAGLFLPLSMFGLDAIVMRRSAAEPGAADRVIASALVIRACGAIAAAAMAVAAVAVWGGPEGATPGLMGMAALILLAQPADTFNAWFKAAERMAWVAVPRIAVSLAVAGAAAWLVHREAGLEAFVGLRAAEAGLMAAGALLVYLLATMAEAALRPSRALVTAMCREGWPLMLSALAGMVYMRIDQVMLGQLAPEAELGRYGVAVRVADVGLFVPMALQAAVYAGLVRAHSRAPGAFDDHMQRVYDAMALAAFGAVAGIGLAAALLFEPVFGAAYAGGLPIVLVLLLGLPFAYLGVARSAMLTVRGWLWTAPATTMLGALVNIALNLVLIPRFGGLGAAWATVVSYWLAAHGTSFLLPWLRPAGRGMTKALNPVAAAFRLQRIYVEGSG
jgi:O-antigen/teichoic acid export membrane protein